MENSQNQTKRATRGILSIIVISFTLFLFYKVLAGESAAVEKNKEIVMYILGALSSFIGLILNYYFGSSEDGKT